MDYEFVIQYPNGKQANKNAWGNTRAEALAYLRGLQQENAGTPNAFEIVNEDEPVPASPTPAGAGHAH